MLDDKLKKMVFGLIFEKFFKKCCQIRFNGLLYICSYTQYIVDIYVNKSIFTKEINMNILSVGKTEIELHGFDDINDIAFFIFRKGGLVITNNADGIQSHYYKIPVNNKIIKNDILQKKLIDAGFSSDHAFIKHLDSYYSENLL